MTAPTRLTVDLLSDVTFGRGEGTAGEVDVEVEHDDLGLPFLGGKTLHGLLRDGWLTMADCFPGLAAAAERVLGPAAALRDVVVLFMGDAVVEPEARSWIERALARDLYPLAPGAVLRALTAVRSQTSEDRSSGAPEDGSLRTSRVVIRGLRLEAPLRWQAPPGGDDLRCLALGALSVRHAGLGRHRGRGHVSIALDGDRELTYRLARGGAA